MQWVGCERASGIGSEGRAGVAHSLVDRPNYRACGIERTRDQPARINRSHDRPTTGADEGGTEPTRGIPSRNVVRLTGIQERRTTAVCEAGGATILGAASNFDRRMTAGSIRGFVIGFALVRVTVS